MLVDEIRHVPDCAVDCKPTRLARDMLGEFLGLNVGGHCDRMSVELDGKPKLDDN